MEKLKKFLFPIYILFLILAFFYVKAVLQENVIQVSDKEAAGKAVEIKPAVAYLNLEYKGRTIEYRRRMQNTDTVLDFMERLRDNDGFFYEKLEYTYGTEFEQVNNINIQENQRWALFKEEEEITHIAGDIYLADKDIFLFRVVDKD